MSDMRTPIEQAIWEIEYHILMNGVEINYATQESNKFRSQLIVEKDRKKIEQLNNLVAGFQANINQLSVTIDILKVKLDILENRKPKK